MADSAETEVNAEQRSLDRSLLGGLAWTGGVKWTLQLFSWASTFIVARLLTPADFGLFGMTVVYLGLVELVNELGLSASIVQRKELDPVLASELGGLSVLFGVLLCALSLALAGPVSLFFGETAVRHLVQLLSLTFITSALQVLPRALLIRELRFRRVAVLELVEGLVLTVTTLVLALAGLRYWALAFGALAARIVAAVLANVMRPHAYRLPLDLSRVRGALAFGGNVVAGRIAFYLYSNADFAVVGNVLGKAALGAYSLGWQLANIPVDRIASLVNRISPTFFARLQHDDPGTRRYLRAFTEGLSLITFPASTALAVEADDLVRVALGAGWDGAVLPLRLLAVYASFRSVTTLFPNVLVARGLASRSMRFNVVAALVMPALFIVAARWGTTGVAAAWIVGYPLVAVPLFMRSALRLIGMSVGEWLGALWPAASAALGMAAAMLGSRVLLAGTSWPTLARLVVDLSAGAVTYLGLLWILHRVRLLDAVRLLRQLHK